MERQSVCWNKWRVILNTSGFSLQMWPKILEVNSQCMLSHMSDTGGISGWKSGSLIDFALIPIHPNPKMSASKQSMAILVTVFSGSAFAFETPVKTCCPPGQFLAIEDWQGSRQYVEGLWFSQYHPGIIVLCSSLRTPPRRLPQRMGLPRLASNDAGQRYVSSDQGLQCPWRWPPLLHHQRVLCSQRKESSSHRWIPTLLQCQPSRVCHVGGFPAQKKTVF